MRPTSGTPPSVVDDGDVPIDVRGNRRSLSTTSGRAYAWSIAVVAIATLAAAAGRALLQMPDVEMLFLLGVTVVAVTAPRGPSVLAAALSVAAYDFFFVRPPLTFDVDDLRYLLTFAMMFGIGVVISTLMLRVREEQRAALDRERRTAALYAVSRRLGAALGAIDVAEVCVGAIAEAIHAASVLLVPMGRDELVGVAAAPSGTELSAEELGVAQWALLHGSPAGNGTPTFGEVSVLCVPLRPLADVLAVAAVRVAAGAALRPDQRDFLDAVCRQGALALERVRLAEEARQASLRVEAERLRSALLSSVSHDLRTPLAAITGAATTLRDEDGLDADTRGDLIGAVCDEAERLERLVGNLLDMTRLESGSVEPRREWVPLVEVIGAALTRLEQPLSQRRVTTTIPDELPLLSVDPVLLEQLFSNVLENTTKYTPPGSPLDISARRERDSVVVEVADRGPGLPAGAEEKIFERFRRGDHPAVGGAGLGLAIARAIASAHGGALVASNRPGGGAVFRLELPLGEAPPTEIDPGVTA
jgi:two-component system sensor histidine kinase KdpD